MPRPLAQFIESLTASRVMTADEIQAFLKDLPPESAPKSGDDLAGLLVNQQWLTPFQVQQIFGGKGKSLVLGNYVILDKLGQGGMGMVLRARHRRMDRVVALKVLSPQITKTPELLARFQREVKAAARLQHSHIVTAYDADEAQGVHFLVMEYVSGTDLSSVVKKRGPLPLPQAVSCILQAAQGLEYSHRQGIIHRDIKPANLLLSDDGVIKILDMGLARIEGENTTQADLTGTGMVMGTLSYMAPEQAVSTKSADARSDMYSLGITLWYLLTGQPPYTAETMMALLLAHREGPIPSLLEHPASKSGSAAQWATVDAIFRKMVAKRPQDRYADMTEVISVLESCLRGDAVVLDLSQAISQDSQLGDFLAQMSQGHPTTAATAVTHPSVTAAQQTAFDATITAGHSGVPTQVGLPNPLPSAAVNRLATSRTKPQSTAAKPLWQNRGVQLGVLATVVLGIGAIAFALRNDPPAKTTSSTSVPTLVQTTEVPKASSPVVPVQRPTNYALRFTEQSAGFWLPQTFQYRGQHPITIEAWVYPDHRRDDPNLARTVWKHPLNWVNHWYSSSSWELYSGTENSGYYQHLSTDSLSYLDEWVHVAAVVDDRMMKLFINGEIRAAQLLDSPLKSWDGPEDGLLIGEDYASNPFLGLIDEFRISKAARYSDDYFTPQRFFTADDDTLVLYHFDEGRGNQILDDSPQGYHTQMGRNGERGPPTWELIETPKAASPAPPAAAMEKRPSNYALRFTDKSAGFTLPQTFQYTGEHPLTVEAWVNPDRGPGLQNRMGKIWMHQLSEASYVYENSSWQMNTGTLNTPYLNLSTDSGSRPSDWVHVAGIVDEHGMKLFVDGQVRAKQLLDSPLKLRDPPEHNLLWIGDGPDAGAARFHGLIDEVHISRSVRYTDDYFTPERFFTADDDTLVLYHFDEGRGNQITDDSRNGYHTQLTGQTWGGPPTWEQVKDPKK